MMPPAADYQHQPSAANSRFYFPIMTCIVVSVVLSLMMWLVRSVRR
jgi:hypothetical protein